MIASKRCIDLIKKFEGFRAEPYLCPAGVPTIGIGSTHYKNGLAVTLQDAPITEIQAEALLLDTLKTYELGVKKIVKVELNQNEFDALVDFCYNIGIHNFKTSTLLKDINLGNFTLASHQFVLWTHINGQISMGLLKRRLSEKLLFLESMP